MHILAAHDCAESFALVRPARADDAENVAALFRAVYGKTSHPSQDSEYVRRGIASGNELWHVAQVGSQLAGCMCVVRHHWNRSSEIGGAIILPRHRTLGLGLGLTRACLDKLYSTNSTLSFCIFRSYKAHWLANRISGFPWILVGHDSGRTIVNGAHEYHLYAIAKPAVLPFHHVAPVRGAAAQSSFVRDGVYTPLGLTPAVGRYPDIFFAGASNGESDSTFRFSYDPMTDAIELLGDSGARKTEAELARSVGDFVRHHRSAGYISAQVVADKAELIGTMLDIGFEITGYLPAWLCHEGARYDCVMLVKRQRQRAIAKNGFESEIDHLNAGLATLACQFQGAREAVLSPAA